jgi:hypothetical protein
MDGAATVAFVPCGHVCLCIAHEAELRRASGLVTCRLCTAPATGTLALQLHLPPGSLIVQPVAVSTYRVICPPHTKLSVRQSPSVGAAVVGYVVSDEVIEVDNAAISGSFHRLTNGLVRSISTSYDL